MSDLPGINNIWRAIMHEREILTNENEPSSLFRTRTRDISTLNIPIPPPPKINIPNNKFYSLSPLVTDNQLRKKWNENDTETYVGLNKLQCYPPNQQKYLIIVNGGVYDARLLNYMYMLNKNYHIPIKLPHTSRLISDNNNLKNRIRTIMQNNVSF
jgi:hypothetical protein